MNIDTQKLDTLLSKNNREGVTAYIKELVNEPIPPEERGEALAFITTTYMNAMNNINEDYKKTLEFALEELDKIEKSEKEMRDKVALKEVRMELNK